MITNENLSYYCNNFYGYGSWENNYWVLALEESVESNSLNQIVDVKINRFWDNQYTSDNLIDNHLFQMDLVDANGDEYARFLNPNHHNFAIQNTWRRPIQLISAIINQFNDMQLVPDEIVSEMILNRWGRSLHDVIGISLIELYPLPLPKHSPGSFTDFYNPIQYHPHQFNILAANFMQDQLTYKHNLQPIRFDYLINKIIENKPSFILAMGISDYLLFFENLTGRFGQENININSHLNQVLVTRQNGTNLTIHQYNIMWGGINNNVTKIIVTWQPTRAMDWAYWNSILNILQNE